MKQKHIYEQIVKLKKESLSSDTKRHEALDYIINILSNIDEINENLNCIYADAECQYNSLEQNDDVSWDCYDKDNWLGLQESAENIKKYLKLD